jgi:hypothetical protein
VHITYGGIASVGLPAVKRLLRQYVGRLQAILRSFYRRGQQIPVQSSLRATMQQANANSLQSQSVTSRLQRELLRAQTAAQLSSAFNAWIAALRPLAVQGDAMARKLGLTSCLSSASP